MRDDIDPQLLPIFLEEAQQLVPQIGADLRDWKANPADEKISQSLRRALHTLKGSARMAGAIRLGELTPPDGGPHRGGARGGREFPPDAVRASSRSEMDRLSLDVERMAARPAPGSARRLRRAVDHGSVAAAAARRGAAAELRRRCCASTPTRSIT